MRAKASLATQNGIMLFHENEHRIYGDSPERVADLFASVKSPNLKAAYDPANFVFCGYDPIKGWEASKPYTAHFHIKDWKTGAAARQHSRRGRRTNSRRHGRRGKNGLQGFCYDGTALARRRPDRRRHRAGFVPEGGCGV